MTTRRHGWFRSGIAASRDVLISRKCRGLSENRGPPIPMDDPSDDHGIAMTDPNGAGIY